MLYVLRCGSAGEAGPPRYDGKGVGKVAAWGGVTQNCKAERSVYPSNDGCHRAQAHSPTAVSLWQWEETGFEPMQNLSGERFAG